jgi:hypothetical protein
MDIAQFIVRQKDEGFTVFFERYPIPWLGWLKGKEVTVMVLMAKRVPQVS